MRTARALGTFGDEARAFHDRHRDLPDAALAVGSVTWGLWRALAECPRCPDVFRVPTVEPADGWHCFECGGTWVPVAQEGQG